MLDDAKIKLLRNDFPQEAVQKREYKDEDTGKVNLTLVGYKPQYYIERLNDAFGHDGWDFEILDSGQEKGWAWVKGRLTIYYVEYDKTHMHGPVLRKEISKKEQFGTSRVSPISGLGDAFKGAATNCMEKAASLLDIGHKAYKGQEPIPGGKSQKYASKSDSAEEAPSELDEAKNKLLKACKDHKINKEAFKVLQKTVLKEEKDITQISLEEINKLVEYLEKNKAPF